jgi:hypothetical protein
MNYSRKHTGESLLRFYSTQPETAEDCRFGLWLTLAMVGLAVVSLVSNIL